jgi:hypothetical protein
MALSSVSVMANSLRLRRATLTTHTDVAPSSIHEPAVAT